MKKFAFLPFSILLFFLCISVISLSSCGKEKGCTTLESDNFDPDAEEDDNSCIPWRKKFEGTYDATETCTGLTPGSFLLVISPSGLNEQGITFTLGGQLSWTGKVVSRTSLEIPSQPLGGVTDPVSIFGNGTFDENLKVLKLNYTITGSGNLSCKIEGNQK